MMSQLCSQVLEVVRGLFPELLIKIEEHINYKGQKLFLDIFVPQLGLVIEVHGRQHDEYVEHFHGNIAGFKSSKQRDRLKEEWAKENGFIMVSLRDRQLPITPTRLLELIDERSDY